MDQDRQIRFLIPPFFLYASLFSWMFIDPYLHCSIAAFTGGFKDVIPLLAAAGPATIPIGFFIGGLTTLILNLMFDFWSWRRKRTQVYEACVSDECFRSILLVTRSAEDPRDKSRRNLLYATATFDHELLPQGIHTWLGRRWNAFNVAASSTLAIALSILVAIVIRALSMHSHDPYCGWNERQWQQMSWGWSALWWLVMDLIVLITLVLLARRSWRETMGMIEFQARRWNVAELGSRPQVTSRD